MGLLIGMRLQQALHKVRGKCFVKGMQLMNDS
jgi:hypothetical protein